MAELIEMPFGLWTWVDPRNHVLDEGPYPRAKGQFWEGKTLFSQQMASWRARSTILLQWSPSFREMSDQVRFSCRKLCWNV